VATEYKFGHIYDSTDCHVTAQSLRRSIPEAQSISFDLNLLKPNADLKQLLETTRKQCKVPDVILFETGAPGLPRGVSTVSIPTCCLDIDTFGWTQYRLRWAMLFDYVFTWHPSYVQQFQNAGHPRVFALPHAVDANLFRGFEVNSERTYDCGFVGNSGLPQYRQRDRVIAELAKMFRTNDFGQKYNEQEMAEVYRRSKIVVNVSRAEFPQDANMRCYEAMAAGTLLMTGMPTELSEWGFREGEHFIGWHSEAEIPELVNQFLYRKELRLVTARAGQERTLKEFTYQRCIERMVDVFKEGDGHLFAPARQWPPEKLHLLYLSYYHRLHLPCAALEEFRLLRRSNPRASWRGLPTVLKAVRNAIKSSLI
jgi:Glycosyl transferases group 1/DUF based on E. rectale Gene description (DUF3880)